MLFRSRGADLGMYPNEVHKRFVHIRPDLWDHGQKARITKEMLLLGLAFWLRCLIPIHLGVEDSTAHDSSDRRGLGLEVRLEESLI